MTGSVLGNAYLRLRVCVLTVAVLFARCHYIDVGVHWAFTDAMAADIIPSFAFHSYLFRVHIWPGPYRRISSMRQSDNVHRCTQEDCKGQVRTATVPVLVNFRNLFEQYLCEKSRQANMNSQSRRYHVRCRKN